MSDTPTILVTGSTRGIGAAIADALEAKGAFVIRHGTRPAGDRTLAADLSDPAAPAQLWDSAPELAQANGRGRRIDVLINNAGVFEASAIDSPNWLADWERCLQINLTSAAQLSRLAVQSWLADGAAPVAGRLVNIASRAAYRGDSPDYWHYAAAKAGEVAMTKTIARAYAASGILAFAICPGFTDTAMAGDYIDSRDTTALAADIPLGRVAQPDEIAAIAEFCALDAPPSMTGAMIDANGASFVR